MQQKSTNYNNMKYVNGVVGMNMPIMHFQYSPVNYLMTDSIYINPQPNYSYAYSDQKGVSTKLNLNNSTKYFKGSPEKLKNVIFI